VNGEHKEFGTRALSMLSNHLERIAILVPEKQLAALRKVEIQIEYDHPELKSMQYHPDLDWIVEHHYDPALAKRVHIPHAADMISRKQMLKHPAMVLHELAHAYHDQVLTFDDPGILKAYDTAMKDGKYEKSLLYTGQIVKHYATTNHKEYFAESTEAYFYHNDFYPFVRAELKQHDPTCYAEMERVWGKVD
jgi:dipeptidyl-peptidase-4